jgi:hypothetical protein
VRWDCRAKVAAHDKSHDKSHDKQKATASQNRCDDV